MEFSQRQFSHLLVELERIAASKSHEEAVTRAKVALGLLGVGALLPFSGTTTWAENRAARLARSPEEMEHAEQVQREPFDDEARNGGYT
jgi:hypothetical protein